MFVKLKNSIIFIFLLLIFIPQVIFSADYYLTDEFKNPSPDDRFTVALSCATLGVMEGFNKNAIKAISIVMTNEMGYSAEHSGLLMHDAILYNEIYFKGIEHSKKRFWDDFCEIPMSNLVKLYLNR